MGTLLEGIVGDGVGISVGGMSNLGNTSGTTGTVGSQLLFAGGNNVTLSQSINGSSATITISAFNAPAAASQTVGMSNIGNTSGTTGVIQSSAVQLVFAGGNNVTLSQSINGASGTITISAANETQTVAPIATAVKGVSSVGSTGTVTRFAPEDHQHAGVFSVGASNVGNTAGNTSMAPGQFVFAGSNDITISQQTAANGLNTIHIQGARSATTISAVQSANSIGTRGSAFALEDHFHQGVNNVQISGNTSNTSNQVFGSVVFAGGNNITLSQATAAGAATITISGINTSQGSDTLGISNLGNSAGTSGTINGSNLQLLFAGGNNVTLSQSVNGSSATITVSAFNQTVESQSMGISNLGNTAGTSGIASGGQVRFIINGGNNITCSQSVNGASATVTISAANAGITEQMAFVTNWNAPGVLTALAQLTQYYFPIIIPHKFSASSMDVLYQVTTTNSTFQWTLGVGIYTINNGNLSLATSHSSNFGYANTTNASNFSSLRRQVLTPAFNFTPGNYWVGLHSSSAGTGSCSWLVLSNSFSPAGQFVMGFGANHNFYVLPGLGFRSTALTNNTPPNSMSGSDLYADSGSAFQPWVQFRGTACP